MVRDEVLISTDELADLIDNDEKFYLIDFTINPNPQTTQAEILESFNAERIPGAKFFPALETRNKKSIYKHMLPKTKEFSKV
jgi:3-mercaptopyruvate sulfurtransferase SseA